MPLKTLTQAQRSHITQLHKHARILDLIGYDLRGWPVVCRTDQRGTKQYAVHPNGAGRPVMEPIQSISADEAYDLEAVDFNFLARLNLLDLSED